MSLIIWAKMVIYFKSVHICSIFTLTVWTITPIGLHGLLPLKLCVFQMFDDYKPWYYDDEHGWWQIAGYVSQYTNLKFLTVKVYITSKGGYYIYGWNHAQVG